MQNKLAYLLPCFLLCQLSIFAQDDTTTLANEYSGPTPLNVYLNEDIPQKLFDEAEWAEVTKDIDYDEQMRVDRYDEDFSDDPNATNQESTKKEAQSQSAFDNVFSFLMKSILVVGLVALVAFILSRFLGGSGINVKRTNKDSDEDLQFQVENIEQDLVQADVKSALVKAEEASDYKLALRLQFLSVVKALAEKRLIFWKKDKTNRTYSREIENVTFKNFFRKITGIYEEVWYGDRSIGLENYSPLKKEFQQFIKQINSSPAKQIKIEVNE